MVADHRALDSFQGLEEEPDLGDDLVVGRADELSLFHSLVQGHVLADVEGPEPDVVGIDLVQDLGRLDGMLPPPALAPQPGHDVFGKGDPRFHDIPSAHHLFLGGNPFLHELEEGIIAGLHPDVDAGKARLSKFFQLFHRFPGHRSGPGITGDPLDGGKCFFEVVEDLHQVGGLHHEGIAVLEKDLGPPEIQPAGHALVSMTLPAGLGQETRRTAWLFPCASHLPGKLPNFIGDGFHPVDVSLTSSTGRMEKVSPL